ncbi:thioesterase II family protein [Dyadobacter sp. OTU695]|uniref:thioesterase II family protein n=1 Tax=Dyadobacter sp. OTU695 TaxID=3043860 RepID=UPI00313DB5D7
MNRIRLFCLPFAGGSKYSYRDLQAHAPDFIEFVVLEYPGRGARISENLKDDLQILVDDVLSQIICKLGEQPYAIYGHSMGGLIAYLVVRELVAKGYPYPQHLFLSGIGGPSAAFREDKKRHLLDRGALIEEIKGFQGSGKDFFESEELINYYEPILRADFTASENYSHETSIRLPIQVTVVTGTEEDLTKEEISAWDKESAFNVAYKRLPGGHFFIFKYAHEMVQMFSRVLHERVLV